MPTNNDESKIMKNTRKRKEKFRDQHAEKKANSIETVTMDILQSKKSEQKHWLSFQDIVDGFQYKALFIDYWNKSDEFKKDLVKALKALETNGKIEKQKVGKESYFSSIS